MKPLTYLDETDKTPDLQHGVPGLQWAGSSQAKEPAKLRSASMPADDAESYALYLGLIFAIALVLRVLVVMMGPGFDIEHAFTAQTAHQAALADGLAVDHAFGLEAQPENSVAAKLDNLRAERGELATIEGTTRHPEFYQTPGYPAVLAAMNITGLSLTWLLVLQCLIGAACVPLVYRVGLGVTGRKMPSALAAVLVALHPALIFSPAMLAADTIVVALVLLGLFGVAHMEERGFRSSLGGGLAIGVAALFTPLLAWLTPLLGVWLIISERRFKSVALAVVMLVGTALPLGGWMMRNSEMGYGPYVSAHPAIDRLFGTLATTQDPPAAPFDEQHTQQTLAEFRTFTQLPENAEADTLVLLGQFGREQFANDTTTKLIAATRRTAPQLALDHSLDQAYAVLGVEYIADGVAAEYLGEDVAAAVPEENVTGWVVNAWVALNAAIVVGMVLGAGLMLWRRRWSGLLLLTALAGFWVLLGTAAPTEATRLPFIAVQALMVTAVLAPGALRVKKTKSRKLRKFQKIDQHDESPRRGSPLATEESLRPGQDTPPAADADEPALNDAVHPALANAAIDAATPPTTGDEAKDFARQVEDDRLSKLATSGRPI